MANWRRSLVDAFWVWDRALRGQRRPTRIQIWVAVPVTLFCLMLSREEEPYDPLFAAFAGLAMGLVFGLTAVPERLRQRRLKCLGIWDGS
ncbi:hypothetical protein ABT063_34140 [Streptomyces sp. NPDC002838]|uniref:hypothetical protein n=1 Tax=Streptomyces sp. NPDC002838 TaxID=3154436 RepID=UPI0033273FE1